MNGPLIRYTVIARAAIAAAYLALGVWIVSRIAARSPDAPVATQTLDANYKLTAADLQTEATAALVGRYLRTHVDQGRPVTADNVSKTPVNTTLPPSLAAIVSMKPATLDDRNIVPNSRVLIVVGTQKLSGVVADVSCDPQNCSVIVTLAKMPGQTFDAFGFSKADLVPDEPPGGAISP